MSTSGQEKIGNILADAIPKDLLLTFETLYGSALERAGSIGRSTNVGHRNSVTGQLRHFLLNEASLHAFDECGISHSPLRGNAVLVGKCGIVTLGRIHMNPGAWDNSRRSKAKRSLCEPNRAAAMLVQMPLFDAPPIAAVTAFLVTVGGGSDSDSRVYIVVPDGDMDLRSPVFIEELSVFMQRYQPTQVVPDTAQPTLKPGIKKKVDRDQDQEGTA